MAERVSRRSFTGVAGVAAVGALDSVEAGASQPASCPFRRHSSLSFRAIDERGELPEEPR